MKFPQLVYNMKLYMTHFWHVIYGAIHIISAYLYIVFSLFFHENNPEFF